MSLGLIPWFIDPENGMHCHKLNSCSKIKETLCPKNLSNNACFENFKTNKDNIWERILKRANEEIDQVVSADVLKSIENISEFYNSKFIALCLTIQNSKEFYDWVFNRKQPIPKKLVLLISGNLLKSLTRDKLLNQEILQSLKLRFSDSLVYKCVNDNECGGIFRKIGDACRDKFTHEMVVVSDGTSRRTGDEDVFKNFWVSLKQCAGIHSLIDGKKYLIKSCILNGNLLECQVIVDDAVDSPVIMRLKSFLSRKEQDQNIDNSYMVKEKLEELEGHLLDYPGINRYYEGVKRISESEILPKIYHQIKESRVVSINGKAYLLYGGIITEPINEVFHLKNISDSMINICQYYTGLLLLSELLEAKYTVDYISYEKLIPVRAPTNEGEICPLIKLESGQYLNTVKGSMANKYSLQALLGKVNVQKEEKKYLCDYVWNFHRGFPNWAGFKEEAGQIKDMAYSVLSQIFESNEIDCSELVVDRIRPGTFEELFMAIVKSSGKDQIVVNTHK
jgi:hypothetical protein